MKMYDFEIFGKWSKDTLLEQGTEYSCFTDRHTVESIENKYNQAMGNARFDTNYHGEKKLSLWKIFIGKITVEELHKKNVSYLKAVERQNKVQKQYRLYQDTMIKLWKTKKPKKETWCR